VDGCWTWSKVADEDMGWRGVSDSATPTLLLTRISSPTGDRDRPPERQTFEL
jgi:hypothetical protein